MFGLGNIFGGKNKEGNVDRNQMFTLLQNPEVRRLMAELQSRLSKDEQKQLMELAKKGEFDEMIEFLRERVPEWDDLVKKTGLVQ